MQLGVDPSFAASAARQLGHSIAALRGDAYAALLQGITAGHGAQHEAVNENGVEVEKLVQDFAVELQKLDEGLKLLSTYLLRIRERNRSDSSPPTVH